MSSYRSLSYTCQTTYCKSSSSLHYCRTLMPQKIQVHWYTRSIQVIELLGNIARVSSLRDNKRLIQRINKRSYIWTEQFKYLIFHIFTCISPIYDGYIKKLTKWLTPLARLLGRAPHRDQRGHGFESLFRTLNCSVFSIFMSIWAQKATLTVNFVAFFFDEIPCHWQTGSNISL